VSAPDYPSSPTNNGKQCEGSCSGASAREIGKVLDLVTTVSELFSHGLTRFRGNQDGPALSTVESMNAVLARPSDFPVQADAGLTVGNLNVNQR
jgi:hypothetical protein